MTKRTKILAGAALAAVVVVGGGGGIAVASGLAGGDDELTGSDLDRASVAAVAEAGGGKVTGAELGDDGATYEVEVRLPDGREVDVDLDAGFKVTATEFDGPDRDGAESTGATGNDRSDDLIGELRDRASAAALAEVPGTVTDAETADIGTGYDVTVTIDTGAEFDIVLDKDFAVVSSIEDLDD